MLEGLVHRRVHEIESLQTQVESLNETLRRLRDGHNEFQGGLEMVSGAGEQIHVQLGGYRPFRALQPNH